MIRNSRYNVRDFGAKGDGSTDDSSAFSACMQAIWNAYSTNPPSPASGDGSRRPIYTFYIPAGVYKITTSEAMMSSGYTTGGGPYLLGLVYEGDGKYMTYINFQPTAADTFLLYNNDAFMHLTFRDMTFNGNSMTNCSWLKSRAGNAQNYTYERVNWGGSWKYGLNLLGDNLNSEQTFFHCNVNGAWNVFLYVDQSVGMSGDQFVNYNFYGCNMEVSRGSFIDMAYGGSIGIWGGSYMYYAGTSTGGTMFVLRNSTHHNGACRFLMAGARVEMSNAVSKMIDCSWGTGSVTFLNVDNSVQAFQGAAASGVNSTFHFGNESGPTVSFVGCVLQGKHEYRYSTGHNRDAKASYYACEFWHYQDAASFISLVNENANNNYKAGAPMIKFDQCRGKPTTDQNRWIFDTTLNWNMKKFAIVTKKILRIVSWENQLPSTTGGNISEDVWLPLGSIITNVQIFGSNSANGGTNSATAGWVFTLKTSEGTPTTLITATPIGNNPSSGINSSASLNFLCDTDAKRHIVLAANSTVDAADLGYCLVEYIG